MKGVIVHVDADAADPDGRRHALLAHQLSGIAGLHPAVAVQATEAWWFLFPDEVESLRPTAWHGVLSRTPGDVETIANPKRELRRCTRGRRGAPEYSEADSPRIAANIARSGATAAGTSRSFDRLGAAIRALA